jgi:gliding motility-associated-like protein
MAFAQVEIKVTYTDETGTEVTATESFSSEAPLPTRISSNATELYAGASVEWHIRNLSSGTSVTRYDEETSFTFTEAGINTVSLIVRQDNEVVDSTHIDITITESHLEMPNAFSPNGDGHNDFYGAKGACHPEASGHYKSIVEFHAYIFNRWGQQLYEWGIDQMNDGGWDGTSHGKPVKDGVYFIVVKAKGSDGIKYNIRHDINILRGYESTSAVSNQ